jgi:hypothetical protein
LSASTSSTNLQKRNVQLPVLAGWTAPRRQPARRQNAVWLQAVVLPRNAVQRQNAVALQGAAQQRNAALPQNAVGVVA